MDSHIIRKAAARLPALADLAVLRFNFRGVTRRAAPRRARSATASTSSTTSPQRCSSSRSAACRTRGCVGWSFGTEVALKYGLRASDRRRDPALPAAAPHDGCRGRRLGGQRQAAGRRRFPSSTTTCGPSEARERFAVVPEAELVAVEGGKHLWVGEAQTYRVLTEIVRRVNPAALPLPTELDGQRLARLELVLPRHDHLR